MLCLVVLSIHGLADEGTVAAGFDYAGSGPGLPDPRGHAATSAGRSARSREDPLARRKWSHCSGCCKYSATVDVVEIVYIE